MRQIFVALAAAFVSLPLLAAQNTETWYTTKGEMHGGACWLYISSKKGGAPEGIVPVNNVGPFKVAFAACLKATPGQAVVMAPIQTKGAPVAWFANNEKAVLMFAP